MCLKKRIKYWKYRLGFREGVSHYPLYGKSGHKRNTSAIFHGGCVTCVAQEHEGIKRCKGCKFFEADWNKPDLSYNSENREERMEVLNKIVRRNKNLDSILGEND